MMRLALFVLLLASPAWAQIPPNAYRLTVISVSTDSHPTREWPDGVAKGNAVIANIDSKVRPWSWGQRSVTGRAFPWLHLPITMTKCSDVYAGVQASGDAGSDDRVPGPTAHYHAAVGSAVQLQRIVEVRAIVPPLAPAPKSTSSFTSWACRTRPVHRCRWVSVRRSSRRATIRYPAGITLRHRLTSSRRSGG